MDAQEAVKPCPFCGKSPDLQRDDATIYADCSNEYCDAFDFPPIPLAAWNRRPIEDAQGHTLDVANELNARMARALSEKDKRIAELEAALAQYEKLPSCWQFGPRPDGDA